MRWIQNYVLAGALGVMLSISGCKKVSDDELGGLESIVKNSVSGSGAFKFEAELVSSGNVGVKPMKLVKVKFTDVTPMPRQCVYVLYYHDTEAGLLRDAQVSLPDKMRGTCSVNDGCFGCEGKTFTERLKDKGYTGAIKDI